MISPERKECNAILKQWCKDVKGDVLSIGSSSDSDKEGKHYRNYFEKASSYTTSEANASFGCDLVLDVTNMESIPDEKYDCIFCIGVLEHVFDFRKGLDEMTRILKKGGTLILGVPFNQKLHCEPTDYWRFTLYALEYLLKDNFKSVVIEEIGKMISFPASLLSLSIKK